LRIGQQTHPHFDQAYADASDAIERTFELQDDEEAAAAASGPPASTSTGEPSPAVSAQPAPVIPLEQRVSTAEGGTA
jgi:hypothetical protein